MGAMQIFTASRADANKMVRMQIQALGDSALLVRLGDKIDEATHARVQAAARALDAGQLVSVSEIVPAYTTVTLYYSPIEAVAAGATETDIAGWLGDQVRTILAKVPDKVRLPAGRQLEIPICYDAEFAPDLEAVAHHAGLAPEEVIRLHGQGDFLVYLIGFAPGFPYMGGLPPSLAMPRRAAPRVRVAPGSVGIIGIQCCIYPIETPGGWNLIGRTPLRLYRPELEPPALLRTGDRVKFCAISRDEFENWGEP
jgi:inhibitor of KinA